MYICNDLIYLFYIYTRTYIHMYIHMYTYTYIYARTYPSKKKKKKSPKTPYSAKATSVHQSMLLSFVGVVKHLVEELKVKLLTCLFLISHLFKQGGLNLKEIWFSLIFSFLKARQLFRAYTFTLRDENADWVNEEGKGKGIYYYSFKWVMWILQGQYISVWCFPLLQAIMLSKCDADLY